MRRDIFGGRYASTGAVFSGGGGDVYICDDPNLDRRVVVKFLRAGVERRRLQDELTSLQKIRSKNVIQVLDVIEDRTRGLGIVAEYLPGNDLTVHDEWPTDRLSLLRMVYQLANGLNDIHCAGIIHRDIKPNNIKYGDERILKIFDFNLARDGAAAQTVGFRGTHGFGAPEQYSKGVVNFTPAIDVYSLATTLACILSGGILPSALTGRPPKPELWVPGFSRFRDLDGQLADLLDAALSVKASERPSAESIRDAARNLLRRNAHRATITVRGVSTPYQLDATHRIARLAHYQAGGASLTITYDGLSFVITESSGAVFVNHSQCWVGQPLPDSCVLDLGSPSGRASDRLFCTFDLSHPEVVQ